MTGKTIVAGIIAGLLPNLCSVILFAVMGIEAWLFFLVHFAVLFVVAVLMRSVDKKLFSVKMRIAVILFLTAALCNLFVGYGNIFRMIHPEYNYEYKFSAGSGLALLYLYTPMCVGVFFAGIVIGKILTNRYQRKDNEKRKTGGNNDEEI